MKMISNETSLQHFGIPGMKWGVRRYQNADGSLNKAGKEKYRSNESDSSVTKKVKSDLRNRTGAEFQKKYAVSNTTYMKRVDKYVDPYMNAPLAKLGKALTPSAKKNADSIINRAEVRDKKVTEI